VREVKYLTEKEIKSALLKNKNFNDIVKKRVEHCVSHVFKGRVEVLVGEKAVRLLNKYIAKPKEDFDKNKVLKGMIAYPGKVKGTAKIVLTKEDVDKVKEGDVLVSPSTNPDLIVAMKKAIAFITDRGGITSHAAIVARELKKPCISGTENATKILKDGDLVEVDAENGIAKKLIR
jgi:pyruvate,water dikinase